LTDKDCPLCGKKALTVIYYGLPHLLCEDVKCSCLWGWTAHLTQYLPFNGVFIAYRNGYWQCLFKYLMGSFNNKEGE